MDIEQMHYDVLEGRSDYIPLIINIKPEGTSDDMFDPGKTITNWESMKNPQAHIDTFMFNNERKIQFCISI